MIEQPIPGHNICYCFKRISWTAILLGALVGVGISFILSLFSLAIGLTSFTTTDGVTSMAVGGFIGLLIATIVSTFVSGWTAGYLGNPYKGTRNLGVLYGFAAWILALLILIVFAAPTAKYVANLAASISHQQSFQMKNYGYQKTATTSYGLNRSDQEMSDGDVQKIKNDTAKIAFALFILILLGAISNCLGGYFGAERRKKTELVITDADVNNSNRI